MAELNGDNFIARVRLSDRENRTLAVPGERCGRVPASSLAALLNTFTVIDGERVPVIAPAPPAAVAPAAGDEED